MKTQTLLLFFLFFLLACPLFSQTPTEPYTSESFLGVPSIDNVMNTGVDYVIDGQDAVILMVYDGDSPYFLLDIYQKVYMLSIALQ